MDTYEEWLLAVRNYIGKLQGRIAEKESMLKESREIVEMAKTEYQKKKEQTTEDLLNYWEEVCEMYSNGIQKLKEEKTQYEASMEQHRK